MKNKNILIILSLFICSFLIGIFNIPYANSQTIDDNIDYEFEKNTPYDSYDLIEKEKINLRHNNIITNDYNGTYSFNNDTIGNIPIGWDNLSVGNGQCFIQNSFKKHNKILNISTIDTDDSKCEQIFDNGNQVSGIIEFWLLTTKMVTTSYIVLYSTLTPSIYLRIAGNVFQTHNGSWQTFYITPLNNIWFHIKIDFNCITDTANFYINDYYEGNFGFTANVDFIDRILLRNTETDIYSNCYDAIGYSWSSNYTITENIYPNIELVDSNILTSDMYQFNFDSNGNPYINEVTNIVGWNTLQSSDYCGIDIPSIHYYYYSHYEPIKNKNAVYIVSHISGSGIKNESIGLYNDKINITFGINFESIDPTIQHYVNFIVKSSDNTEIIKLKFLPIIASEGHSNDRIDLLYYDGSNYQTLTRFYKVKDNDVYNFNIYIENFIVDLMWFKNDIYNNTYNFPLIESKKGVNALYILNYDSVSDSNYLFLRLTYIGIYQYNISYTNEYSCMKYNFDKSFDFSLYNIFNFTSNDFIKIITVRYTSSYIKYIIRELNNYFFTFNLYEIEVKDYNYLWLITNQYIDINQEYFSIEGIKVYEYIDNIYNKKYIVYYNFLNIDSKYNYYYVDNYHKLNYVFNISQDDVFERMRFWFNINPHQSTNNKSIYFKGKETTDNIGFPRFRLYFRVLPHYYNLTSYEIHTYYTVISSVLRSEQTLLIYYFEIHDNNSNIFTNYISKGYIYNLRLGYLPKLLIDPSTIILTLSLIAIMIPIIVIIVPTIGIYGIYKKKTSIIPTLLLMSIICYATALIPFELFFIMAISLGCLIFIQYRKEKVS